MPATNSNTVLYVSDAPFVTVYTAQPGEAATYRNPWCGGKVGDRLYLQRGRFKVYKRQPKIRP